MGIDPADGSVIWNEVYGSLFTNAAIWDIGIDDAGDISISGYASADASFGGPAIGGPAEGNVAFFAKLTSERTHRFSFSVQGSDLVQPFALHRSGTVALTGWGQGASVNIAGTNIPLGDAEYKRYLVMLSESGQVIWGREFFDLDGSGDGGPLVGFWGGGIAIDSERNVLLEHGLYRANREGVVEEWPERISKLDVDGTLRWTEEFSPDDNDAVFVGEGGLTVDSHDNILHSDDRSMIVPGRCGYGVSSQSYVRAEADPGRRNHLAPVVRRWLDPVDVGHRQRARRRGVGHVLEQGQQQGVDKPQIRSTRS